MSARDCLKCGNPLPADMRADALYCSDACNRAAYQKVRRLLDKGTFALVTGRNLEEIAANYSILRPSIFDTLYGSVTREEASEVNLPWNQEQDATVSQRILKSDSDIEHAIANGWSDMLQEACLMMYEANSKIPHPQDLPLIDNDPAQT